MARAFKCDFCGRYYDAEERLMSNVQIRDSNSVIKEEFDVCPGCINKILEVTTGYEKKDRIKMAKSRFQKSSRRNLAL